MPRRQVRSSRRSSSGGPVKPRQPGTGAAAAGGAPARKAAPDRSQEYLDLVGSMMVALDRRGRITMVNRRGCDVLGWNEAEVLGRDWFDTCVPERLRGEVRAVFDRLMAGELTPVEYFENPIVRRDGIERIVAWHNTVLRDAAGRPNGTLSAGDDVTERRQVEQSLRESEQRYRLLVENSMDAILMTAPDGRIFAASPAACRMFGRSEEEICRLGRDGVVDRTDPRLAVALAERERAGRFRAELTLVRADGSRFPAEVSSVVFRTGDGSLRTSMFVRDITERKRAEEEAAKSRREWELIFQAVGHPVMILDAEHRVLAVNEITYRLTGLGAGEIEGRRCYEVFHHSDAPPAECPMERKLNEPGPGAAESEVRALDRHLLVTCTPVTDCGPKARRFIHIATDITELKRTEQALRESEARYHTLFENSQVGIYRTTPDGRVLLANPALLRMLGYSSFAQLAERSLEVDGFHPSYPRSKFKARLEAEGSIDGLEAVWFRCDGAEISVREHARCVRDASGKVLYYDGTAENITERKRAEEALREGEERFRRIVETAHEGIWVMDAECRTTFANRRLADMLGLRPEDVMGRPTEDFLFPEDVAQHSKRMEGRQRGEAGSYELRLRRSDGAECWALVSGTALADAQGGYAGSFAMLSDITIQKRTEVALQQRTDDLTLVSALNAAANRGEKLAGLVELLTRELQRAYGCENVTFYSRDASGSELSGEYRMNPRLRAAIEGLIGGQIPPVRVRLDQPSPYREVLESKMPRLFDTPAGMVELAESFTANPALRLLAEQAVKLTGVRSVLLLPVLSGGSAYGLLEMTGRGAFPSEQVERLGFVASQFMAIVDRKVEEEELAMYRQRLQEAVEARSAELRAAERLVVRAEKLATLGRVAGSVAHELRNPLGAIRNASYYLQKTASDRLDGKHLRHLQIIDEYVGRANNAITAILDFTQGRPTQRVRCALRPIVERAVADAALPQTVNVRLAIDDGLPAVLADDQQMAVVFRNLLINASQAMSGHGRVRVSASAARGRVVVGVADQGVGISREHMARLFEPLFTTKEIGVGLGLAICRAFIEANGGSIKIDSEVGKGTTVRVSLPAAQPEPAAKS